MHKLRWCLTTHIWVHSESPYISPYLSVLENAQAEMMLDHTYESIVSHYPLAHTLSVLETPHKPKWGLTIHVYNHHKDVHFTPWFSFGNTLGSKLCSCPNLALTFKDKHSGVQSWALAPSLNFCSGPNLAIPWTFTLGWKLSLNL